MLLKRVTGGVWQVLAVCRTRGDCPLLEDLAELEADLADDRARMLRLLERVAHHGPPRNLEKSKSLGDDLFEFRAGRLRVFWFYGEPRKVVVCSHVLLKSTQKTPRRELQRADRAKQIYLAAVKRGKIDIED